MCGQVGLILGKKRRSRAELDSLGNVFTEMLLRCEKRGQHATGLALLKTDGSYHLFKRPEPAHLFIKEPMYQSVMADFDRTTTLLMGHTRLPTFGDPADNRNNHPIRAGIIIGTHNGSIYNADRLFRKLRLPRFSNVDSEIIFRMADRFSADGSIELPMLKESLSLCRGQMSAVLASRLDPDVVTVLKGNRPLHLAHSAKKRVILYASEREFIEQALPDLREWTELDIPPMTAMTIHCDDLKNLRTEKFHFKRQKRKPQSITGGVTV